MKKILGFLFVAGLGLPASGAVLAGAPEPLLTTRSLSWVSAALFYQQGIRPVVLDPGDERALQSRAYEAALGLDILPWLTLYGSVGGVDARFREVMGYGDPGLAWGAGLNITLWQWSGYGDIPVWRLKWRIQGDLAGYESEGEHGTLEWQESSVTLPFSYEVLFVRHPESFSDINRLELFLGPAYSGVDGRYERGGERRDFDEQHNVGLRGGATLYITRTLFLNASAAWFEDLTVRGGIGYSFE